MGNTLTSYQPKGKLFRPDFILHHYAVLPMIFVKVHAVTVVCATIFYMLHTRDISFDKTKLPLNMRMDLLNPRRLKLMWIDEEMLPAEELHDAYEKMNEARSELKEESRQCLEERKKALWQKREQANKKRKAKSEDGD